MEHALVKFLVQTTADTKYYAAQREDEDMVNFRRISNENGGSKWTSLDAYRKNGGDSLGDFP